MSNGTRVPPTGVDERGAILPNLGRGETAVRRLVLYGLAFIAGLTLWVGSSLCGVAAAPDAVDLVLPKDTRPPVQFGAEELRAVLEKNGVQVRTTSSSSGSKRRIYLGERGDPIWKSVPGHPLTVPDSPESYVLAVLGRDTVAVEGSDAAGTMYGALDLAEQIGRATGSDFASQIQPVSKSPFLAIRGINMFLTAQGFDEPDSWYWSDSFWTGFLDMMARDRYNFLDFHGPFDLTVSFPNGFPFFVFLPDFPEIGVGRERAARNLARFRQVIRMAADRGIKVGYMNYTAAAAIGPWKTGQFWKDERWVERAEKYLAGERLEEYTRRAVTTFLEQLSELWIFGFRIGESGQPEDFYKRTYLAALKNSPASLNLYARTWAADPHRIREIANQTGHHFYIEPKFNGEHLGLPYQAVTGGRFYPFSGSYEDYTNYPRNYSIIWQIRANGTHRVFHWGWPEFARRTARSCRFGGGAGFSMEPMNAYYPQIDYLHNNPETDHTFYHWMYEQQWFWYMVWGRTGYDPEVSDRVWLSEFERRFGPAAGPHVFRALVETSKIVPFVYSYHCQGLDHQMMAPEYETGDHSLASRDRLWQGKRLVPYGGNNEEFLQADVLDRTAMADPVTYVDDYLKGRPIGKMTPFEAAQYLDSAAVASEHEINQAAELNPSSKKEFECIQMDVGAVGWLGRYYRDRILSATHLQFYKRTYHHPELTAAYDYVSQAVVDWSRLSAISDRHFGYVPELIRMGVYRFRWADEGRILGHDLDEINQMESKPQQFIQRPYAQSLWIGHCPPLKLKPSQAFTVVATVPSGNEEAEIHLFYRNSRNKSYTAMLLKLDNAGEHTWTAQIPAQEVVPGFLEYYFEGNQPPWGPYGGTLDHQAPYHVLVNDNDAKPAFIHVSQEGPVRGDSIKLSAEVTAQAKISAVRVYYKRMPAFHNWLEVPMERTGGNRYEAAVPLTSEGILYYFEAVDEDGNGVHYPDFLKQAPYFVIDGWAPTGD